jgi:streptogramin lyase
MRFGIPAALLAVIALALPAFASADPLGSLTLFKSGLRGTAFVFNDTAGPDGNVWFVDSKLFSEGIPAIGRVKPSGEITEFVSGTNLTGLNAGSDPVAIAAGPEGEKYLWFTDKGSTPAIGRIDSASPETAEEFSTGLNPGSVPQGIVAGPDGNLWFADAGTTPAIGMIDPSKPTEIKEFSTGLNPGSAPKGIVAGADGNLWFTDGGTTRAIGKINPSTQEIEEFATGANSEPGGTNSPLGGWGIAAGADGNVWFTESGSNETNAPSSPKGKAIGRITPSGTITYFQTGLAASSKPFGLTADGGKLWFADRSSLNEKQEVTVEATENLGGTYKLGFGGKETGWTGEGTLSAPVSGTGNVFRVTGGQGTWVKESKVITITKKPTSLGATGEFAVGQLFQSTAPFTVGFGAVITACEPGCKSSEVEKIIVSVAATETQAAAKNIVAGGVEVKSGGPFEVGKTIAGTGIPAGATIKAVTGSVLALSAQTTTAGEGVSLTSGGSTTVTGVTTSTGKLSNGEEISGTCIPAGTTISSFNEEAGTITLSKLPTCSGKFSLSADLSYGAESFVVQQALEKLSSIGAENAGVEFETGTTSPVKRTVVFEGALGATDVEQLSCNGAGLTGTSPSCTVTTTQTGLPNAVGSISTSGEITRYPKSGLLRGVSGIVAGPDGNLWLPTGTPPNTQFAKFGEPPNRRALTLKQSGNGTVSSKPKGIKCAAVCSSAKAAFYKNSVVTLTAKPGTGATFTGWSTGAGTCTGTTTPCQVTMSEAKSLTAAFSAGKAIVNPKVLTLDKEGTGYGTVKATGLTCEAECTKTTASYYGGVTEPKPKAAALVTLKQVPAFGSAFSGWSGCDEETEGNCIVSMSKARSVSAEYTLLPTKALTVNRSGNGTVSSKPKALKCAAACSSTVGTFPEGAVITLTAKPGVGATFTGWTVGAGTCTGTTSPCQVTMSEAVSLTAAFSAGKAIVNPKVLTLTKAGSGFGTVKATGLTCEALCTSTSVAYYGGVTEPKPKAAALVTLTAVSAPGSDTVVWSGCGEEKEGACIVSMSAAKAVTATFDELE